MKSSRKAQLAADPGVLEPEPVCEFQGYESARTAGSVAVLPWRAESLAASTLGIRTVRSAADLGDERFGQCLVHLQKSRAATWSDLTAAWHLLKPDGRLLLCGGNNLGITSAVKRLAKELDQQPRVLTNRAHARIVRFLRNGGEGPLEPVLPAIEITGPSGQSIRFLVAPGVFSEKRVDAGSEILLSVLGDRVPPQRIVDLGCGNGVLGLMAAIHFPESQVMLLDADARAIVCTKKNRDALEIRERGVVHWWDAREAPPDTGFDLALINPPFHDGKAVDFAAARAIFSQLPIFMKVGATALIVANRALPYEANLSEVGSTTTLAAESGYKLLSLTVKSRSRSSGVRRRHSPSGRSRGRS